MSSLKKFKFIYFSLICFLFLFVFIGCKKDPPEDTNNDDAILEIFPEEFFGVLDDKDIYITSIGQAIDIEDFLIEVEYTNLINYHHDNLLSAAEVPNGAVVLAVVGCSIKGLGDVGITVDEEMKRAQEFINASETRDITLIAWHIGGMSRRGATSDQIINLLFRGSDLDIFIKYGNEDGFLSKSALDNNIPCYQINYLTSLGDTLKLLLGINSGE